MNTESSGSSPVATTAAGATTAERVITSAMDSDKRIITYDPEAHTYYSIQHNKKAEEPEAGLKKTGATTDDNDIETKSVKSSKSTTSSAKRRKDADGIAARKASIFGKKSIENSTENLFSDSIPLEPVPEVVDDATAVPTVSASAGATNANAKKKRRLAFQFGADDESEEGRGLEICVESDNENEKTVNSDAANRPKTPAAQVTVVVDEEKNSNAPKRSVGFKRSSKRHNSEPTTGGLLTASFYSTLDPRMSNAPSVNPNDSISQYQASNVGVNAQQNSAQQSNNLQSSFFAQQMAQFAQQQQLQNGINGGNKNDNKSCFCCKSSLHCYLIFMAILCNIWALIYLVYIPLQVHRRYEAGVFFRTNMARVEERKAQMMDWEKPNAEKIISELVSGFELIAPYQSATNSSFQIPATSSGIVSNIVELFFMMILGAIAYLICTKRFESQPKSKKSLFVAQVIASWAYLVFLVGSNTAFLANIKPTHNALEKKIRALEVYDDELRDVRDWSRSSFLPGYAEDAANAQWLHEQITRFFSYATHNTPLLYQHLGFMYVQKGMLFAASFLLYAMLVFVSHKAFSKFQKGVKESVERKKSEAMQTDAAKSAFSAYNSGFFINNSNGFPNTTSTSGFQNPLMQSMPFNPVLGAHSHPLMGMGGGVNGANGFVNPLLLGTTGQHGSGGYGACGNSLVSSNLSSKVSAVGKKAKKSKKEKKKHALESEICSEKCDLESGNGVVA